jgi:hypothetical protein
MMAAATLPEPPTLPRLPKVAAETSFDALRAEGIRRVQALAGTRWTDYNLHDPGVTLLEAACFALTEGAYRVDFPVADHLSDEHDRIAWARHGLLLPQQAFPCRPTTATDLRRSLLDRLPVLDGVTLLIAPPADADVASPAGVMHLLLDAGASRHELDLEQAVRQAHDLEQAVRQACAAQRNLGEDLGEVRSMCRLKCRLCGEISIGGSREPAEIVAELLESCGAYLASTMDFDGVAQALERGQTLDRVYEGPTTRRGIAQPHRLQRALESELFITDLVARARATPGVLDVAWLALRTPDGRHETASLPWRDLAAGWTLALAPPADEGRFADLTVKRRGNVVDLSARELRRRLDERRAGRLARRHGQAALDDAPAPPAGRHQGAPAHFPLQNHLPAVYAVGEHGLPATAGEQERARARQLQGYLALFDQAIAHGAAQVARLRDLYATDPGEQPSYHWHVLGRNEAGEEDVPGLAALAVAAPADVEREVCQPFDDHIERRSRLLDLLLALHGQNYPQHSLRQFCDHLAPRERERALLANKLRFLREIVPPADPPGTPQPHAAHPAQPLLNRDRASGFDWMQPSWNRPGNSSALQRRVGLLLGFDHDDEPIHSRPLAGGLERRELVDLKTFEAREPATAPAARQLLQRPALAQVLHLGPAPDRDADAVAEATVPLSELRSHLPIAARRRLPGALLRCAVRHDRYLVAPGPLGPRLLLGPDESGAYWELGSFEAGHGAAGTTTDAGPDRGEADPLAQPRRMAAALRALALRLDARCEGLHIVEHVLLRPLGGADAHAGVPAGFHALQLSAVFPAWTLRCHQPAFRVLARETVQLNAPAHLMTHCHWLEPAAMATFETQFEAWLQARVAWAGALGDTGLRDTVDRCAAALARQLADSLAAQAAGSRPGAGQPVA